MRGRGTSTIGLAGTAALFALVCVALWLPAAASAATDGQISGTVTKAAGGAVVGAEVCASSQGGGGDFGCAQTQAGGTYSIAGLEPGAYRVAFEPPESEPFLSRQLHENVNVVAEQTTEHVDAALAAAGAISGKVVDAGSGAPIAGVEVCSFQEEDQEIDGCTDTAPDGTYKLAHLEPVPHEVEFWAENLGYEPQFRGAVAVSASNTTASVNAALFKEGPRGRISGHVYAAATHQLLSGVAVCAIDGAGQSQGCARTGSAGAYQFIGVPPGPWRVAFSPAPGEFEAFEAGEIFADAWPTQFWNLKPTLAQADVIGMNGNTVTGIDALLGAPPVVTPPPVVPAPVKAKPKRIACKKGFVKKRVKGKTRCVKRHKHHKKHHRRHRKHSQH